MREVLPPAELAAFLNWVSYRLHDVPRETLDTLVLLLRCQPGPFESLMTDETDPDYWQRWRAFNIRTFAAN
jgi:hypothetical protein